MDNTKDKQNIFIITTSDNDTYKIKNRQVHKLKNKNTSNFYKLTNKNKYTNIKVNDLKEFLLKDDYYEKFNNIKIKYEGNSDIEYFKKILSLNLNYIMDIKKKNPADISKDLQLSYSTVSDWVNGVNYPRIDKIEKLANYFNVSKNDLIDKKLDTKIPVFNTYNFNNDNILDFIDIPKNWLNNNKKYFACTINDDTMSTNYILRRHSYI